MSEPQKIETELTFDVPPGYRENERLDLYVTSKIQNATRARVQKGIKDGLVVVGSQVITKSSYKVQAGDHIVCTILKAPPMEIVPENIPLDIVYEDDDLLVVNKAAGMVVHPAYGHRSGTLVHALLFHVGGDSIVLDDAEEEESDPDDDGDFTDDGDFADDGEENTLNLSTINASPRFDGDVVLRPGIVHRLDKDTSGLLVVAKNNVAHVSLAKQFMNRTTRRRYQAIVWGIPTPESSTIDTILGRDTKDRRKVAVIGEKALGNQSTRNQTTGKRAITHYSVVQKFGYCSMVEFRLETGRTHQIRVHAAHIGNPIFGDTVYGGDRIRYGKDEGQRKAFYRNLFLKLPRQALHARSLGFKHPRTGQDMDFEVELPPDMTHVVEKLGKFDIL